MIIFDVGLMRITNHQHFVFQVAEEGANDSNQEQLKGKVVKFGWLEGVFVSGCRLISILLINRFHVTIISQISR